MKIGKFTAYMAVYLLLAVPLLFTGVYVFVSNIDDNHKLYRALTEVSYRFNRAQDIAPQIEKDPRAALEKNDLNLNHKWNPGHSYIKQIFNDAMSMHPYIKGIERQALSGESVARLGEAVPEEAKINLRSNRLTTYGPIWVSNRMHFITTSPVLNDDHKLTNTDIVIYEPSWLESLGTRLAQTYRYADVHVYSINDDGLFSPKQKNSEFVTPDIALDKNKERAYVKTKGSKAIGVLPKFKVAFYISNTKQPLIQKLAGLSRNIKMMILGMFAIICALPFLFFLPKIPIWTHRKLEKELMKERYAADSAQHLLNEKLFDIRSALSEIVGISDALTNTSLSPKQTTLVKRLNSVVAELRDNDPESLQPQKEDSKKLTSDKLMSAVELKHLFESLKLKAAKNNCTVSIDLSLGSDIFAGQVDTFKKSIYHLSVRLLSVLEPGSELKIIAKDSKMDSESTTIVIKLIASEIKNKIHWPDWCRQLSILSKRSELSQSLINCTPLLSDDYGIKISGTFKVGTDVGPQVKGSETSIETEEITYDTDKPTILVVDDNTMNRRVLSGLLEKRGCEVVHAQNGEDAVKYLSQPNEVQLVFMDLEMPVMNGLEATKAIREKEGVFNPEVPVVALTAHAKDAYESGCISSGMNDYLTKPILPTDVKQVVKKWCKVDLDAFKRKK